ncbi:MAG: class I tRNA ligase family protein, partial [Deltaproteobacteria bacterium]|nr:class I tRNA ligase family protein [Deltaproteobacteria bacterium]
HCWRCKKPVIFRATEQWFISMAENDLRRRALEQVDRVRWIPAWGRDRIHGMLSARPDWCLSRQRTWGLPIPAFYCEGCNHAIMQRAVVDRIADIFARESSDAWFVREASELLPPGFTCPRCGGAKFRKEKDIVDVWFESGVSYAAVCEQREQYPIPVDLYLEGSDQHRGWFHSTLLAAVGTRGVAPYKTVLTHGFVVDGEGRKYSKSSQNYVPPERVIEKHGAEIFRLWVCATDFRGDLRFSDDILARLVEAYRKMRNTIRFMLGNLADFDPRTHSVPDDKLQPVDRYLLAKFGSLVEQVRKAYEVYDLHVVYQRVNEFAIVDLSAFYFDLLKDWLYCDPADAPRRRSAQTALYRLCRGFLSLLAPVLSFTAEEAHDFLPDDGDKPKSVHLTRLPEVEPLRLLDRDDVCERFDRMRLYREQVMAQLETFRAQKHHPLEARAIIAGNFEVRDFLGRFGDLAPYFSVSQVEFCELNKTPGMTESDKLPGFAVRIEQAQGAKCGRCWMWSPYVGTGANPELCERCNRAVGK